MCSSFIVVCVASRTLMGVLWGDGPIFIEGLWGLVVLSLKLHSFSNLFHVVFILSVNVHRFEDINCSDVESFPLISLVPCQEGIFWGLPVGCVAPGYHCCPWRNISVYDVNLKMVLNWLFVYLYCMFFDLAWGNLLKNWGDHGRGSPASESLIITW